MSLIDSLRLLKYWRQAGEELHRMRGAGWLTQDQYLVLQKSMDDERVSIVAAVKEYLPLPKDKKK